MSKLIILSLFILWLGGDLLPCLTIRRRNKKSIFCNGFVLQLSQVSRLERLDRDHFQLNLQNENENDSQAENEYSLDQKTNTTSITTTLTAGKSIDPYLEFQQQSYFDGVKPDSSWNLAINNFKRQGYTLIIQGLEALGLKSQEELRPPRCLNLVLSNQAVAEAERRRIAAGEDVDAHPVSKALYAVGCYFLDEFFDGRPIQRFWFLETIARIPYFAYVSMLHLYESFGWFRAVELRRVHIAEGKRCAAPILHIFFIFLPPCCSLTIIYWVLLAACRLE
jgi:hypothetical protein